MGPSESSESSRKKEGGVVVATESDDPKLSKGEVAVAVAVGLGAVALGVAGLVYWVSSSSRDERKTMKAPGRNGQWIFRDDFERDPSRYFHGLRK